MKVGDVVCFKSDYEQCGRIVAVKSSIMGSKVFVLEATSDEGFSGDYIGGQMRTQEMASDCWVE
jgi:hypothetical protein